MKFDHASRISLRHVLLSALLTTLLIILVLAASQSSAKDREEAYLNGIVTEVNNGPFIYRIVHAEDRRFDMYIELPATDEAALNAYAKAVAEAATDLFKTQKEVEGLVIFRRPLPEEALPSLILAHKERVVTYSLRWISADGERVTIFGMPSEDEFLPRDELALQTESTSQMEGAGQLRGFMVVTMRLDQALYDALSKEPDVFMVDVGPAVATREARNAGFLSARDETYGHYPFIFWYLEDLEAARQ